MASGKDKGIPVAQRNDEARCGPRAGEIDWVYIGAEVIRRG